MEMVILPNVVRDIINAKLDAAFVKLPEAEKDREILYQRLLRYFYDNGEIPDFELQKNAV